MIVGVGTDLVEVARLAEALERTPTLRARLFTPAEAVLPLDSLAARFAAKEALSKALSAPGGLSWQDAEVVLAESGRPSFVLRGTVAAVATGLGVDRVQLSLSHDGGFALAFVVLESSA
ncbi:MAG: holo-ACP synthase [Marmoricola sp.]